MHGAGVEVIAGEDSLAEVAEEVGDDVLNFWSTVVRIDVAASGGDSIDAGGLVCEFGTADDFWEGRAGSYNLFSPADYATVSDDRRGATPTACASVSIEVKGGQEIRYTYPDRSPFKEGSGDYSEYLHIFPGATLAYYGSGGPQGELAEWNSCSKSAEDRAIAVESRIRTAHVEDMYAAQEADQYLYVAGIAIGVVGNLLVELLRRFADRVSGRRDR